MMPSSFTVSYDAEVQDFLASYALFKTTCKKVGGTMRRARIFAGLWLIACVLVFATQPSLRTSPVFIGISIFSLYILLLLPAQERWMMKKQWNKIVTPPSQTLPITVTFDDEQISFLLRDKSEARFYWSAIVGIAENDAYVLFLVAERMFYYIPKRVLSEEILTALRSVAPIGKEFKC